MSIGKETIDESISVAERRISARTGIVLDIRVEWHGGKIAQRVRLALGFVVLVIWMVKASGLYLSDT